MTASVSVTEVIVTVLLLGVIYGLAGVTVGKGHALERSRRRYPDIEPAAPSRPAWWMG